MAKKSEPAPQVTLRADLYPWTTTAAAQLRAAHRAQKLPHAVLVHGADGLGKQGFAGWLAQAVLCDSPHTSLDPCNECTSCQLYLAGTHPDVLVVMPEEDKQQISIDQIRAAVERLSSTSYRGGYKALVIAPAEQMTMGAANSLLKTLEEPTANSIIVLLTSRPSAMPATIRSRCQKLAIPVPPRRVAIDWLQSENIAVDEAALEFAAGAPLRMRELMAGSFEALNDDMVSGLNALFDGRADVTQVAAKWGNERLPERLTWLDLWLAAQLKAAVTGNADLITFPTRDAHLPTLPAALNITAAYSLLESLRSLRAHLARTALQRELAVAGWLISLLQLTALRRAAG